MKDGPENMMSHEDNSSKTKIGVIGGLVLLALVFIGCLLVLWQVIKFIITLFS